MKNTINPLHSVPTAIILGAVLISLSILLQGGIIKIGKPASKPGAAAATPVPTRQPAQVKTQEDVVRIFKDTAAKLGLDESKFSSCLDSGSKAPLVSADSAEGVKAGVNGTPAFFINGRLVSGAVPFEQFKKVIDEELNGTADPSAERVTMGTGNLPVQGKTDAKVTLIEFSDYECVFCGRHFTQTEGQIKKEYIDTGKVKFYYRDFPLPQIHPNAQKAAEAARCAGDQNKYWQYHDALFQNQQQIFSS